MAGPSHWACPVWKVNIWRLNCPLTAVEIKANLGGKDWQIWVPWYEHRLRSAPFLFCAIQANFYFSLGSLLSSYQALFLRRKIEKGMRAVRFIKSLDLSSGLTIYLLRVIWVFSAAIVLVICSSILVQTRLHTLYVDQFLSDKSRFPLVKV